MRKAQSQPVTSARGSRDDLARAIAGAVELRAAGFLPARITVGAASIDLAIPAYPMAGGRGSAAPPAVAGPLSLGEEYLGSAAARELERGTPGPGGGEDDEDVPAVRG